MRILWAFLRRDLINETSYKFSFFLQLLSMFPSMLLFFFLSKLMGEVISGPLHPYGGTYFPFVMIGVAVERYLVLALSGFSKRLRDSQLTGTLEAVLTTPISRSTFLFGSTLYSFGFNSLRILIYVATASLLFGVPLDWARLPAVFLVIFLTVLAFSGLGILSASFIILFKKGDPLNWAFNVISWMLGGVYYPVSVLPKGLQDVAQFIPMTHSLEALRMCLLSGKDLSAIGDHLLVLGLWAVIGLPLSSLCFRYALNRARRKGTLGFY